MTRDLCEVGQGRPTAADGVRWRVKQPGAMSTSQCRSHSKPTKRECATHTYTHTHTRARAHTGTHARTHARKHLFIRLLGQSCVGWW